jgi:hypothetical protein
MLSGEVFYSIPYPDLHVTRTTFIIDGDIYGLTIPHESRNTPSFERISNAAVSNTPLTCVGRNKICTHDPNEGTIRTVHFVWPSDEDENRDVSLLLPALSQPNHHELCLPYVWDDDEPMLDDFSNRILLSVNGSWVVLELGYK